MTGFIPLANAKELMPTISSITSMVSGIAVPEVKPNLIKEVEVARGYVISSTAGGSFLPESKLKKKD